MIKEVTDGEYIITTKQPFARSHFFVEEELDKSEKAIQNFGRTFQCPINAPEEEEKKTNCVV